MVDSKKRPGKDLDRIDRNILNELQKDGRISNVELSKRVGLSPTPCLERVRRLERQGFIQGYTALLNPHYLDASLLVFVEITLNRGAPDVFEQFNSAVQKLEEIQECHLVSGDFDYLLKTRLKSRSNGIRIIYSVTINLVPNHLDKRAHKYVGMVRQASRKYGVDESLILAIMQTESSFNPYAVSHADALGLMQVVQHSAGKDVFRSQGRSGTPSRSFLFDPASNIDTGTAYLAMLNNVYLGGIDNPTSRRYAVITAYNGGAGSVLRVFSNDKIQAANIINSMTPGDVYQTLTTRHPSAESRRYLYKVNSAQKSYRRR